MSPARCLISLSRARLQARSKQPFLCPASTIIGDYLCPATAKPISGYYTNDHQETMHGQIVVRRDGQSLTRGSRGLRKGTEGQAGQRAEAYCPPARGAENFSAVLCQSRTFPGPAAL